METLGTRIKSRREQQQLTQPQLAQRVGVTKSAVSQWENGNTKGLRPENLLAVSKALKCGIEWLITGRAERGAVAPTAVPTPPALNRALLAASIRDVLEHVLKLNNRPGIDDIAEVTEQVYEEYLKEQAEQRAQHRDPAALLRLVSSR